MLYNVSDMLLELHCIAGQGTAGHHVGNFENLQGKRVTNCLLASIRPDSAVCLPELVVAVEAIWMDNNNYKSLCWHP
jgi:hypothetical protein